MGCTREVEWDGQAVPTGHGGEHVAGQVYLIAQYVESGEGDVLTGNGGGDRAVYSLSSRGFWILTSGMARDGTSVGKERWQCCGRRAVRSRGLYWRPLISSSRRRR